MSTSLAAGYDLCDLACARNTSRIKTAIACEVTWHREIALKHDQFKSWWQMWAALAQDPCLPDWLPLASGMITRDWMMSPNVTEWKLVDVPELGYFTTDKPFPRGELLLKTKSMISGYYKHQDVRLLASVLAGMLLKLPGKVK